MAKKMGDRGGGGCFFPFFLFFFLYPSIVAEMFERGLLAQSKKWNYTVTISYSISEALWDEAEMPIFQAH